MAAPLWMGVLIARSRFAIVPHCSLRCICTSEVHNKNLKAGRYKVTKDRSKPLTYEQAQAPGYIGLRKTWNSWNTSNLYDEKVETGETTWEDEFIRKLIRGTWHRLFLSEIIIKRRHNRIIIAGLVQQSVTPQKMYFLLGYTEELLSQLFKRPVSMEIQTVRDKKDMYFKWI